MAYLEGPIIPALNTTAGATPAAIRLQEGELAQNLADRKLFSKDNVGNIFQVAPSMAEHNAKAPLASPALTGIPTAPTAAVGTNTNQIATMAAIKAAIDALLASAPGALDTLNELAAALGNDPNFASTMTTALAAKAPLASPTFTGIPIVPTAAVNTNTTQAASTAFVLNQAATATPLMDGTAAVGTATRFAREDHRHPTDTTRAPLASPAFTGVPTAPTATAGTNTTQLATCAYVETGLAGKQNVITGVYGGTF